MMPEIEPCLCSVLNQTHKEINIGHFKRIYKSRGELCIAKYSLHFNACNVQAGNDRKVLFYFRQVFKRQVTDPLELNAWDIGDGLH
jgi:hypothetical protein